ncbi:hypothetical protein MLD38_014915 [Melastoma candidum]|uniref:Uncharacterized protein n=1 Tax=Melastoma candidum TaxID=119954 RepID=A0ACB9REX7_9MYRT|nr:hypothetical protein MLD38_014915 [Melastoma candidum]
MGFGLGFRVVAMGPSFKKLFADRLVSAYGRTNNRLILLDYDGTLLPKTSINKRPSSQVISILDRLSSDPNNVVFIVSGRGKDSLSSWFETCEKLGLSAEHGYFTRWSKDLPWETCALTTDFNWKNIAAPVMDQYTEATDGSFIETKETALVWHHQEADPHFGGFQAKELLDHLESVLANEPVVVKRGQHIVEVKPQVGDDQSDEDMFESIAGTFSNPLTTAHTAEVFTCTVGQKPSMAKYYLDGVGQVLRLLEVVAEAAKLDNGRGG